jgi:chromosomal replication initiation ATPase DnaA
MTDEARRIEKRLRERGLWEMLVALALDHHVTPYGVIERRKTLDLREARKAWYLQLRRTTRMSYAEIGKLINRSKTTVVKAARPTPKAKAA